MDHDMAWIERVRKSNHEFVVLEQHHQRLERELQTLLKRRVLAENDEYRKKMVQKEKLAAKDRMNEILRRARLTETIH